MNQYDLNKLGSETFEKLCQSLLIEIIGPGTIIFGAGKDGAREATYKGKAPYPSQSEQWDGYWIFQVKFHDTSLIGIDKARKQVIIDLENELNKITTKYQHPCDNYILITNVPLSSVYKTGTHDQVSEIAKRLSVKNVHVLGSDQLCCYIEKYDAIRNAYPQFLTPNDVVEVAKNSKGFMGSDIENEEFYASNIPAIPDNQIKRDSQVIFIKKEFTYNRKNLLISGRPQTGKSNFLSQFARQNIERSIAYFITESPPSQKQFSFLFSICVQMCKLLEQNPPDYKISLEALNSLFNELFKKIDKKAKSNRTQFYLIIDSIEWGMKGRDGDRIIDLFPLQNYDGINMLFSCRTLQIENLLDSTKINDNKYPPIDIEQWAFTSVETEKYFENISLDSRKIKKIFLKYGGTPGYLKIVKDTIMMNSNFDLDSAPEDIQTLITQQVKLIFNTSNQFTINSLKFLSASPFPLLTNMLSKLTGRDENILINELKSTGFVSHDFSNKRLIFLNELIRNIIREKIDKELKDIRNRLLECVQTSFPNEDELQDLLLIELQDYNGLKKRLTPSVVIKNIISDGIGLSTVLKRLQAASQLAQMNNDTNGLIKWTLGTNVVKEFASHAIDQAEINALIAIGESDEALRKAYVLKDLATQIRLLARIYYSLKRRGYAVPQDAKESLIKRVEALKIEEIDKDILKRVAIDIFPILPDNSIAILEKLFQQVESQSLIESAFDTVFTKLQEEKVEDLLEFKIKPLFITKVLKLKGLLFERLKEELKSTENTKAKEYIIRQWCIQNSENDMIKDGIKLWQETVITDRKFVIPLKSLRQLTDLILQISIESRMSLIEILKIPEFISIDSPKEEWIKVRLNLAEALFEINSKKALYEINDVYEHVHNTVIDLDEKSFCLSRLLLTILRVTPLDMNFINTLKIELDKTVNDLLKDSAEHFELTRNLIQNMVEYDPNEALTIAQKLNLEEHRYKAVQLVLRIALRTKFDYDHSELLCKSLEYIETEYGIIERDVCIANIVEELRAGEYTVNNSNLIVLRDCTYKMKDYAIKSEVLGNLAVLYNKISQENTFQLIEQSITEWRNEDDLKVKLFLGYKLVEYISNINQTDAKKLFQEVKGLYLEPGIGLAIGNLGNTYVEIIHLAIRAIERKHSDEDLKMLEELIERIPAKDVQLNLYAHMAASYYRIESTTRAEKLIRSKILQGLNDLPSGFKRKMFIEDSLSIIYEYDKTIAKQLVENLSLTSQNRAWSLVLIWSLCRSYFGDHTHIDADKLTVTCTYQKFKENVIPALSEIKHDRSFCRAMVAITNSIKFSFESNVLTDTAQILDLFRLLDKITDENLPDKKNIQHDGYLVFSKSIINGVRSYLYRSLERARFRNTGRLFKKDIRQKWSDIISQAKSIPNKADKVFVLSLVGKYMRFYYDKDFKPAKSILDIADNEAQTIPTLIDRIGRFQSISESWDDLNEKSKAKYLIEKAIESAQFLKGLSADERLKTLVQASYKIDASFAEKVVSELDKNRYPIDYNPAKITYKIEKLVEKPSQLSLEGPSFAREKIFEVSCNKLISDLASGRWFFIETPTLEKWLIESMKYHPQISFRIAHWVLEYLHQTKNNLSKYIDLSLFLETAELIYLLADKVSSSDSSGIPFLLDDSFPVLNRKKVFFNSLEDGREKLQNWLMENVKEYLTISDPYFRKQDIDYFRYVSENYRICVICTDKYFENTDILQLRNEIELYWKEKSTRVSPNVFFIIIPNDQADKLQNKIIITSSAGIELNESISMLDKNGGYFAVLNEEECKELENSYIQNITNITNWFIKYNVSPITFSLL